MDQNEACRERTVTFRRSDGRLAVRSGDSVYLVTDKGIVLADGYVRVLIPWHNVIEFMYHTDDTAARNAIRGY